VTPEEALAEAFSQGYKTGRSTMRTDILNKLDTLEIRASDTNAVGMKHMAKKVTEETD
jgi:hypothetical protein